ncbi:MAG: hypothetical protein AAGC68_03340 [Verrucomicrobiota bacterium]
MKKSVLSRGALAFVCPVLILLPDFSPAEELPDFDEARVSIPYAELKSLWEAAHPVEEERADPPLDHALQLANYSIDFSLDPPLGAAEFEVSIFADGWHSIPLFGGPTGVDRIEAPEGVSVVREGERFLALSKGIGSHRIQLQFSLPKRMKWIQGNEVLLHPAPATRSEVRVAGLGDDLRLRVGSLEPVQSETGETVFHFGEGDRAHRLELETRTAPAAEELAESRWSADSLLLVRYEDGRLHYRALIQAQTASGAGDALSMALPVQASRVAVEGEGILRWQMRERTEDHRMVSIRWEATGVLDRTVEVAWEVPQSPLAESWTLHPPAVLDPVEDAETEMTSRVLFAVTSVAGLELQHPDFARLSDSGRLPKWLDREVGEAPCFTAQVEATDPVSLRASWLPRVETAEATVKQADFQTRLVGDGALLVEANYHILHRSPRSWIVSLPEADQILTCQVNGVAVEAIQRSDEELEFRLPAPAASSDPFKDSEVEQIPSGTHVHLCYAQKIDSLDPVAGRVELLLPSTDLFIHRLDWTLTLPESYEPTAVEGNVTLSRPREDDEARGKAEELGREATRIYLKKEFCRDERPAVEVFYQRKDLSTES